MYWFRYKGIIPRDIGRNKHSCKNSKTGNRGKVYSYTCLQISSKSKYDFNKRRSGQFNESTISIAKSIYMSTWKTNSNTLNQKWYRKEIF